MSMAEVRPESLTALGGFFAGRQHLCVLCDPQSLNTEVAEMLRAL